jgi:hypothetical protein
VISATDWQPTQALKQAFCPCGFVATRTCNSPFEVGAKGIDLVVNLSAGRAEPVTASKRGRKRSGRKQGRRRIKQTMTLTKIRSAVTNGSFILDQVDHRLPWMRRFRDLIDTHTADLGNDISEGESRLVRRCAMLTLQLEMMETRWAANDGEASEKQISTYQTVTNTLRRTLESLGLAKRMKTVGPSLGDILRNGIEQERVQKNQQKQDDSS